jgi:hypothetical protein
MISLATHPLSYYENSSSGSVTSGNDASLLVELNMHGPAVRRTALWFTMLCPLITISVGLLNAWLVG